MTSLRDGGLARLKTVLLLFALMILAPSCAWAVDQQWLPDHSNDVELTVTGSTIEIRTIGTEGWHTYAADL